MSNVRNRIEKRFKDTLSDVFRKFCPQQCLLGDLDIKVDAVNSEEAQYGSSGEFVHDGEVAVRIRNIEATILLDDTLTPVEQENILEQTEQIYLANKKMMDYFAAAMN